MYMAIHAGPYGVLAICRVNGLKCIIPLLLCMYPASFALTGSQDIFWEMLSCHLGTAVSAIVFHSLIVAVKACLSLSALWPCFDLI